MTEQRVWRPSSQAPLVVHYARADVGVCGLPVDEFDTEGPSSTRCPQCLTYVRRLTRSVGSDGH